ncbi:MAG: hypothetical protein GY714_08655 [Desulfobacterales bacterium]|nr:hypothetical protein [Desulfobacterales bacterium]
MPLSSEALKKLIVDELVIKKFITTGTHSKVDEFVEVIATAVVSHITTAALVDVSDGTIS